MIAWFELFLYLYGVIIIIIMNIITHIIAYAFVVIVFLGILGLVLMMFRMVVASFKGKPSNGGAAPLPWWVWWTTTRHD